MSKKEKNVEMGSPMKMPDLASYMQTVIEQLEADKKARRHIPIRMR